jgi:Arc/MetJ-type ribon-helix-helix transcriptional regulator
MIAGMTFAKIAVTLPRELVASAKAAVKLGRFKSVSAYVASAVRKQVRDEGLEALLAEMLEETGGPLTPTERRAADRALGIGKSKR